METNQPRAITKPRPVLVVVYNHRFPSNVPKVEFLYKERFSRIYHLMPFYNEERDDPEHKLRNSKIIPVFGGSHYFQGFFAQGFNTYKQRDASHYIFIADDLILNPGINENNYQDFFKLGAEQSYINTLNNFDYAYSVLPWRENFAYKRKAEGLELLGHKLEPTLKNYLKAWRRPQLMWSHNNNADKFVPYQPGLEQKLPPYAAALAKFQEFGLHTRHFKEKPLAEHVQPSRRTRLIDRINKIMHGFSSTAAKPYRLYLVPALGTLLITGKDSYRPYKLPYPLVSCYADLVIVAAADIQHFTELCRTFASLGLFVEIAIPTSLVLTLDDPAQLVLTKDLEYKSMPFIDMKPPLAAALAKISSLSQLSQQFPTDYLYLHPIKLSSLT